MKAKAPAKKQLTPCQAEKELAALKRLFNSDDSSLLTDKEYERLKAEIMGRLGGGVQ